MRTLLVHIEDCAALPSILSAALLVAKNFGSHIEGLYVPQGLPSMLPLSPEGGLATADVMASLEQGAEDTAERLKDTFERFMADNDVSLMPMGAAIDKPSASWFDGKKPAQDTLGGRGRAFDAIIVGRPVSGQFAPSMVALETALFESGRPLLIIPPGGSESIGKRIAVAWNGSTETARTIAFAMPLLARADEVSIISVEEGMVPGPKGQDIAKSLVRGGIVARTRHVHCEGRAIGEAMIAESQAFNADLMIKGAYTQSRLRQMIFGGATSHILAHADLPIFMAN